jgi:hypothetical protein
VTAPLATQRPPGSGLGGPVPVTPEAWLHIDVMRTALQPGGSVGAPSSAIRDSGEGGQRMTLVGVDLHTREQSIAVLDTGTGEARELRLRHDGDEVERFHDSLARPATVGIESTGYALWFH